MANKDWLGRANKTKKVVTITVAGPVVAAEEWTVTINGKDITFVATTTTTSHVSEGLRALLAASDAPAEFQEMTWTVSDPVVTGTATDDYAGVDITVASSTDSVGGSLTTATVTAATGPEHADNTANWSGGSLPVDSDNIYFGPAEYGPKYGLTALASVTPSLVEIAPTATYEIGLPRINVAGGYTEYRATDFQLDGCTLFHILNGAGGGSPLMRFDFQTSVAYAAVVESTGTSSESGYPALNIVGGAATSTLEVLNGTVGVASFPSEVATTKTTLQSGGTITCGTGAVLNGTGSTIVIGGGSMIVRTAILTATVENGAVLIIEGTGTCTTLNIDTGGTCVYNSSGTCTAAVVYGTVSMTEDRSTRTFTDLTCHPGASVDGLESLIVTNGITKGAKVTSLTFS